MCPLYMPMLRNPEMEAIQVAAIGRKRSDRPNKIRFSLSADSGGNSELLDEAIRVPKGSRYCGSQNDALVSDRAQ